MRLRYLEVLNFSHQNIVQILWIMLAKLFLNIKSRISILTHEKYRLYTTSH